MSSLPLYKDISHEEPPRYKPTLLHHDIVLLKKELSSPFDIAKDRSWDLAIIEINSTQLNVYKLKDIDNIAQYLWKLIDSTNLIDHKQMRKKFVPKSDITSFTNRSLMEWLLVNNSQSIPLDIIKPYMGTRLNSYTLQSCRIGTATDYIKKSYVLRIRIELHQMLLSFMGINKFNNFFNDINTGISLSKPLEERSVPSIKTFPTEITRFRVENFQNFYIKNCINSEDNLAAYRRNTIDHTSLMNREECYTNLKTNARAQSVCSIQLSAIFSDSEDESSRSFNEKYTPQDPSNEFIDQNLMFSLTCIDPLEAKNDWKGQMIITGDYNSKSLSKFKSKNSKTTFHDKLFVDSTSCNKFSKIVLHDKLHNMICKEFVVLENGLVETVEY